MKCLKIDAMPVAITLFRLFLTLPTLYLLLEGRTTLAGFLILLAGVSDWLDGELARRNNKVSQFGLLLDPLVDKIFVLSVLSFFLYRQEIGLLPFVLLLLRELSVSFLRSLSVEKGYAMPASYLGKAKAFFEFLTLLALSFERGPAELLLWLSILLAYVSLYDYLLKYLSYGDGR
ncbi:MAG: CDP-diacylglycerol--glycerol-3-phosphate 3-phosphatidyltransferase [Aquificaceae bacterium]|nr:CDP-diacylglycerol--glycerol-3-phosphate 3-phosphatidyltransferase [Aquificaceae bacterium]